MLKYIIQILIIIVISSGAKISSSQSVSWTQLQGPYGGSIIDITSIGSTIYAARYDGVFYSTNEGNSWQKMPEGNVANVSVIDATPGGTLYVGKHSGGLWWTVNNGASWNFNPVHVAPHSGTWASVVTLGINSSSHIYIQSERSFNGGNTFTPHFQVSNQFAKDYEFDPGNVIYAASNVGVYRSPDGGSTWNNISGSMPNANSSLKVKTNSAGEIFVGTTTNGIYFSSNMGSSWEARSTGLGDLNITAIELDNSGKIYAGTKNGLYVSVDNGISWTQSNSGIPNPWIQAIHLNNGKVYTGTQRKGVYVSNDGGQTWIERNNGIKLHNLTGLEFKSGNQIFLASAYGMYYSDNGGTSWNERSGTIPGGNIYSIGKGNDGSIYAGTSAFGVYKTSDNGLSWNAVNNGLPSGSRIGGIEVLPDNSLIAFKDALNFDTLKLYRSTNGGDQWNEIHVNNADLLSSHFDVDGQGNIYMAGFTMFLEGQLVRSTNAGSTFETINTGSSLRFDHFTAGENEIYGIDYDKIYRSTNQGSNWVQLALGPWGNNRIGPLRVSSDGDLYLYAGVNIYISEDGGQIWSISNTGLSSPLSFKDFAFDENEFAYIFTYEEGVFKSDSPTGIQVTGNILPEKFNLSQNYPNPFNPVTQIKFDLPQNSLVQLTIYDITGKEITKLVNGSMQQGSYSYSFDAGGHPSGVYFYRLDAGKFTDTKRMILVK